MDEPGNDGHDVRVRGVERNAPVLVLRNVQGASCDVAAVAKSESCCVAGYVEFRDDSYA